jgi:glutathione S-transferase
MMKLYYANGTISIAVAIALEESGLPYEAVSVDFANNAQTKPAYLAINPKGRVPALVSDKGTILTETGALLEYIAALAPNQNLIPSDPTDAAHVRSVMYYMASTMHVAHAHKMRGSRWADQQSSWDDMTAKVPQTVGACAAFVNNDCLRGDYVLGDQFSIADIYTFIVCNWLEGDGVSQADYPAVANFLSRMEGRDSVKSVRDRGML